MRTNLTACRIDSVAALPNLFRAAANARKGKSRVPAVEAWFMRKESEIVALHQELLEGIYTPGPYRFFEIHEPKRRWIAAAPFRDRVVHHALCQVMAPHLERRFIARSYSCQEGKGTTAARECCRKLVNRHPYVLKCDVRKFFHNIDHRILLDKLSPYFGDAGFGRLVESVLGSYDTDGLAGTPVAHEVPPREVFPGDDWCDASTRRRGLPIGNLTSQLWANFYLDAMDHTITEVGRYGDYLRYTDDFLIFGEEKRGLWQAGEMVRDELARLRLKLAIPKSRLLACREGVPFCGFRFLPGLRPRLLGATKRRFEKRRHRLFAEGDFRRLGESIFAFYQFGREGNVEGLLRAYTRWPLDARLRRRRGRTSPGAAGRVLEQQQSGQPAFVEPQLQPTR